MTSVPFLRPNRLSFFPITRSLCLLLLLSGQLPGQLPLVRGHSTAASGMLVYDVDQADDMQARTYLYTICPEDASCMRLDFRLLKGMGGRDFIRVFDGPDREGARFLGYLGGKSGSLSMQGRSGCLTFEFTRAETALYSVWTAHWRSGSAEECIDPNRNPDLLGFQDICGPEYQAKGLLWQKSDDASRMLPGRWFRFQTDRAGELHFSLFPDNARDDLNWVLYAVDSTTPSVLPRREGDTLRLASNIVSGAGMLGSTGMQPMGTRSRETGADNPFCRPLAVNQGQMFFLNVFPGDERCGGFTIRFNETVLHCPDNQDSVSVVPLGSEMPDAPLPVGPRDIFSRKTSILRLDLNTKANAPFLESMIPPGVWDELSAGQAKFLPTGEAPALQGIAQGILYGVQAGLFQGYAIDQPGRPIHYADLLQLARRQMPDFEEDSLQESVRFQWWLPLADEMSGYQNALEFVVDDIFDKKAGRQIRVIRYVRLIWSDWEGDMPDYVVAIFPYKELRPLFEKIRAHNPRNQARLSSLADLLALQDYESILIWRSGKPVRTAQQGKYLQDRDQEMANYRWVK